MKKTVETSFKRIETKYVVNKEDLDDLLKDLNMVLKMIIPSPQFRMSILIPKTSMSSKMLLLNRTVVKRSGCGPM